MWEYTKCSSTLGTIPCSTCTSAHFRRVANTSYVIFFAGNALEDLNLDEPLNLAASIDKDLETDSPTLSNSISAGLASSGKHSHCLYVISE